MHKLTRYLRPNLRNCSERSIYFSPLLNAGKKPDEVKKSDGVQLKEIVSSADTIRDHNNCRRQRIYEFGLYVAACMPKYVQQVQIQHNDEVEICCCPEGMYPVLSFLRYHQHACFQALSSATAVDVPSRQFRFEVVYNLLSLRFSERIRFKTYTDELTPLHSAYELYKVCDLFEREIYDMFGIIFTHHPDLRRVLTDYGFTGHPLRKDYPLIGYTEVRYDDELKKIVYEPVEYAQQDKGYQLNSPWDYARNYDEVYGNPPPPPKKA
ncbi:respiratory-chain NADH dehydrogenase, 30 kd subunit domain-containing protein [Phthorimaea operculella]|nr:respiratory-chain NADH dehydrogenase, 30 kd subunit domain-containing protein [Phthorimaea operculella]